MPAHDKQQPYSTRDVLRVCLPLVASLSATTVMEFTDRVFLANYSLDSIAAALPAGITSYLFMAFFGGVGSYIGVFIAQYVGRGNHRQIGAILWQGIHFTLASGIIFWLLAVFLTTPIFALAGHSPQVQELERIYFSILCRGAILHVAMATLSAFFTGRGLTRPVMTITAIGVLLNIPLDYALINGRWGMPELGIQGAAIATVAAWAINVILLTALIFTRRNERQFAVFSAWRFDRQLFFRMLRFGVPGSLQHTLDILGFTFFSLLVGRLGDVALAATNIVVSINALAFMPSMGFSQGISVLVGQALGRKKPEQAQLAVKLGCRVLMVYILLLDLLFIFFPESTLIPFLPSPEASASHTEVAATSAILLRVVAAYILFDALYMMFCGALRGAGDTRFMMLALGIISPLCLILPIWIGVIYYQISVITAWLWVLVFILALFSVSAWRYRQGRWRRMLVIEESDVE